MAMDHSIVMPAKKNHGGYGLVRVSFFFSSLLFLSHLISSPEKQFPKKGRGEK